MADSCPKCGSAAITSKKITMPHNNQVFQKKKCLNCGREFE